MRPPREAWIAYLLLILLGGFGVHHFYLDRTGAGVAMLVLLLAGSATAALLIGLPLLLIVAVWLLVDLFSIPEYVRRANGARR